VKEIKDSSGQKPFLATTALEEFWDVSQPLIFLGDWCMRHSRKSLWSEIDYKVVRNPLEDKDEFHKAYQYADKLYERMLPALRDRLNEIHGTDYSLNYWRIIVGPWLMHYIYIFYDRYMSIKTAIKDYPNFTTSVLSDENFITPKDTNDFITLSCGDSYNLQIYTKILIFLNRRYPSKKIDIVSFASVNPEKKGFKKSIFNFITKIISRYCPIIIKHLYITSHWKEVELFIKSKGKIWIDYNNTYELPFIEFNPSHRKLLENINLEDNEFERLLITLLPFELPKSFVEGYKGICKRVKEIYPYRPKAIFCTDAWYCEEVFKSWAAGCSEHGVSLHGVQYGSDYGISPHLPLVKHELTITESFYSWGWSTKELPQVISSLPATRFIGRKDLKTTNKETGIMLATNVFPRYLYRFQDFLNYDNQSYFSWQQRFVAALDEESRRSLRVRLFGNDWGHDSEQRWNNAYPDIFLEQYWDIPFLKSLKQCRIHVSDHLASTFLDGLIANKPTILFWDSKVFAVKDGVQSYFDELRDVGILYDSPEEAAAAVTSVYSNVDDWWCDPSLQAVRRRFCDFFGRKSTTSIPQWAKEFRRVAKKVELKESVQ